MYDERTHRYEYDNRHRLVHYLHTQYDKTQAEGRYIYDPLGRRTGKLVWKREREHPAHDQMALSRRPYTTWYGWDGDRLTTTQTAQTRVQTIYEPGSFTPLMRIETATAELDALRHHRSLAAVLQQEGSEDGAGVVFPPELVERLDQLEAELRAGVISDENRQWLAGCGLTPEQMAAHLEPLPEPERTLHLYHCDHRGLPLALISPDGALSWYAEYDEWGNVLREDNPHNLQQLVRLPGQQYDDESGLHYNRHRYYNPLQGRYITQDPIGLAGGLNAYIYPLDPINFIDPLGLAGNPATATHITYQGIDVCTGKPYVGYASMQGTQNGMDVLNYRYGNNFSRFNGIPPQIQYEGYGSDAKAISRGLEQRVFEQNGGLTGTANKQNPVGVNNPNRSTYFSAADKYLRGSNSVVKGMGILSFLGTAMHMNSLNSCKYGSVTQCACALVNEIKIGSDAADAQCYGTFY